MAADRARALIELFGGSWFSWAIAARAFTMTGLYEEADAAFQSGLELSPGNVALLGWLAFARGRQGRLADAERIRAELEHWQPSVTCSSTSAPQPAKAAETSSNLTDYWIRR